MRNESTIDGKVYVAWTLIGGYTMAGTVLDDSPGKTLHEIRRVDGTICYVPRDRIRAATCDDVLAACAFYTRNRIGETVLPPFPSNDTSDIDSKSRD